MIVFDNRFFQQMPQLSLSSAAQVEESSRKTNNFTLLTFQVSDHLWNKLCVRLTARTWNVRHGKNFTDSSTCIKYCNDHLRAILLLGDHPDAMLVKEMLPTGYFAVCLWEECDVQAFELLIWLNACERVMKSGHWCPSRTPLLLTSKFTHTGEQLFSQLLARHLIADGKHLRMVIDELAYWGMSVQYCDGDVPDVVDTLYEAARNHDDAVLLSARPAVTLELKRTSPKQVSVVSINRADLFLKNLWVTYRHLLSSSNEGNYRVDHVASADPDERPIIKIVGYKHMCKGTLKFLDRLVYTDVKKVSKGTMEEVTKKLALSCVIGNRYIFCWELVILSELKRLGLGEFVYPFRRAGDPPEVVTDYLCRPEVQNCKVPAQLRRRILFRYGKVNLRSADNLRCQEEQQMGTLDLVKIVAYNHGCERVIEELRHVEGVDLVVVDQMDDDEAVRKLALLSVKEGRFIFFLGFDKFRKTLETWGFGSLLPPPDRSLLSGKDVADHFRHPEVLNQALRVLLNSTVVAKLLENVEEDLPISGPLIGAAGTSEEVIQTPSTPRCCDLNGTEKNHSTSMLRRQYNGDELPEDELLVDDNNQPDDEECDSHVDFWLQMAAGELDTSSEKT